MTREREIEILMEDRATRSEAEKLLKMGITIFEDFEENFDSYMKEWGCDDEEEEAYRKMIASKHPDTDWGVVEQGGNTYYIMYAL